MCVGKPRLHVTTLNEEEVLWNKDSNGYQVGSKVYCVWGHTKLHVTAFRFCTSFDSNHVYIRYTILPTLRILTCIELLSER